MIHASRGKNIGVLAYRGEERREVQVHMVGLLKMIIQQQYVRGAGGGLAITAAAVLLLQ